MLVTQPCLTLSDPMNSSPPGSSVHEILQARILEWVAILQLIFQELDWGLLHCRRIISQVSFQGSPMKNKVIKYDLMGIVGEGNGTLLQYYCLENPMDRGAY